MLSRTADHLFWMARYIERAENTARMLDVNMSTSLLPQTAEDAERGWRAMLGICELQPAFDAKYPLLTARDLLDFMVRDATNPSSIYSCMQGARENARAVRGVLTTVTTGALGVVFDLVKDYLQGAAQARPGSPT